MENPLPNTVLAAVVDTSEDAVLMLDPMRTIRFVNAAAMEFGKRTGLDTMLGISYDEVLKRGSIIDKDGNEVPQDSFPSIIAARLKEPVYGYLFQQIVGGRYTWVKVSSVPLLDAAGNIEYVIVRLKDITAEKSTEDKLAFLLQTSKVLSLTADTEERISQKARLTVPLLADWCTVNVVREDGSLMRATVVHRDPEKEGLLHELAERSVHGSHATNVVHRVLETATPAFFPEITDEFLSEASGSGEWLALARQLGVTSAMVLPITSRGIVRGILSLAYSDSRRRYTAEDFEFMQEYCNHISLLLETAHLYEEIQKRDASKDAFLATLSHELRNPLAPIKSMLELMKLQPHAAEFRHNISVIEHQFDHLTKILTDLLEVNRYSRGKIHAELRRVNLLTVVKNSAESVEPFLKKKHIELSVETPAQAIVIRADQTRLEQALMNILHNAEKFTPEGGHIWMTVSADETKAKVVIRDDGIGIKPEMLENMFEPLLRDEKAPHTTAGLGLGLKLVKEIVQLHEGTVSAASEGEGKGSEFCITLPILERRLL